MVPRVLLVHWHHPSVHLRLLLLALLCRLGTSYTSRANSRVHSNRSLACKRTRPPKLIRISKSSIRRRKYCEYLQGKGIHGDMDVPSSRFQSHKLLSMPDPSRSAAGSGRAAREMLAGINVFT